MSPAMEARSLNHWTASEVPHLHNILKFQNFRSGGLVVARDLRQGGRAMRVLSMILKGKMRDLCGVRTIQYLDCSDGYMNLHKW